MLREKILKDMLPVAVSAIITSVLRIINGFVMMKWIRC